MTTSKFPSLKDSINSYLPQWLKVGELLITFYPHSSNTDRLDRIATEKARPWAQLSVHIFRLLMLITTSLLIYTMYSSLTSSQGPTAANAPKNTLLIPGVNDFIPMVAAPFVIVSIFVAMAAHELAHAVVGRIEGATIDEYGAAFLGPIPIGAYVGFADEELTNLDNSAQRRVFAAGVGANVAIAVVSACFLLLPGVSIETVASMYFSPLTGAPSATVDAVLTTGLTSNLVFWMLFINVNLAVFNTAPAFPLDGGRFFQADLLSLIARWNPKKMHRFASLGAKHTTILTIAAFMFGLFGPYL